MQQTDAITFLISSTIRRLIVRQSQFSKHIIPNFIVECDCRHRQSDGSGCIISVADATNQFTCRSSSKLCGQVDICLVDCIDIHCCAQAFGDCGELIETSTLTSNVFAINTLASK
jgi:hypothetical protein